MDNWPLSPFGTTLLLCTCDGIPKAFYTQPSASNISLNQHSTQVEKINYKYMHFNMVLICTIGMQTLCG